MIADGETHRAQAICEAIGHALGLADAADDHLLGANLSHCLDIARQQLQAIEASRPRSGAG